MDRSNMRIMIVEDELLIQMVNKQMLENAGYVICCSTTSGEEAVPMALERKPHLIIMDIKLDGEMDGITAMEEIQKVINIPVLYVSGNSDEATMKRVQKTNMVDFIVKPVDYNLLMAKINDFFRRQS